MKRIFFTILLIFGAVIAFAQDCYNYTRSLGISYFDKGEYNVAIDQFKAAKLCPDKPNDDDLDEWIVKCETAAEVKKTQDAARREAEYREKQEASNRARGYMNIKEIKFGTRGSGETTSNFYETLVAADVKYLVPQICYDGLGNMYKDITLYVKIIKPDGTLKQGSNSPYGYTFSSDVTIYPGSGKYCTLKGYGNDSGDSFTPGTYRIELWYSGKMIYKQNFMLTGSKDFKVNTIQFGTSSGGYFYSSLGAADIKYLYPRIYYDGLVSASKKITLSVKIFNTYGTLKRGSSSPNGYTYSDDVTISPGKNHCVLKGWGNDSGGSYVPGTYRIELWQNGTMVYKQNFTLTDIKDLVIKEIKFGTEGKGETTYYFYSTLKAANVRYLVPKIYYDGFTNGYKTIELFVKIYTPTGNMMKGTDSPNGYTFSSKVTVEPGNGNSATLLGYGNNDAGSYSPGTYRIEIWYDGKMIYKQNFVLTEGAYTANNHSYSNSGGSVRDNRYVYKNKKHELALNVPLPGHSSYFALPIYGVPYSEAMSLGMAFGLSYSYNFTNAIALQLSFTYDRFLHKYYEDKTYIRDHEYWMSPMVSVRYSWCNNPIARFYTSAGFGLVIDTINQHEGGTHTGYKLGWQATPFGVSIGKKVFGFMELGIGTEYYLIRVGVACRL